MGEKGKKSGVSLRPTSFTSDRNLLEASMEDVVSLYIDKEKQRHKVAKDDENQQECVVSCRVVPTGLLMALDTQADRLGVSRSMLTRCLSHQVMAWYGSIQRINDLVEVFGITRNAANDFGYPDLYDSMVPIYEFVNTSPKNTTFRTIRWVKSGLAQISRPLCTATNTLLAVGYCFSLTKAVEGGRGTTEKYLTAEVAKFLEHVEEQFIRVSGFHDLVRRRAKAEGKFPENTP